MTVVSFESSATLRQLDCCPASLVSSPLLLTSLERLLFHILSSFIIIFHHISSYLITYSHISSYLIIAAFWLKILDYFFTYCCLISHHWIGDLLMTVSPARSDQMGAQRLLGINRGPCKNIWNLKWGSYWHCHHYHQWTGSLEVVIKSLPNKNICQNKIFNCFLFDAYKWQSPKSKFAHFSSSLSW